MSEVKATMDPKCDLVSFDFGKIRSLVWLVLILLVFSDKPQNIAGIVYGSYVKQDYAMVSLPSVILEPGIVGTSTLYMNSTSAMVSVGPLPSNSTEYSDSFTIVTGSTSGLHNDTHAKDGVCFQLIESGGGVNLIFDGYYGYSTDTDRTGSVKIFVNLYGNVTGETWHISLYNYTSSSYNEIGTFSSTSDAWGNFTVASGVFHFIDEGGSLRVGINQPDKDAAPASTDTFYTDYQEVRITYAKESYDYVLEVANQVAGAWKIRLSAYDQSNTIRLENCTIYFHNGGASRQIYINEGLYEQQVGNWYDLAASATDYIAVTVKANSTGASFIYVYLEILEPNTSIYIRYILTFVIT
ncbi:MAG: hypothetical protein OEY31_01855 [Candidatus Bathyarchaeota archaeon]|nr:hypothetical protein [Candidatus Bathyarchaeota archaeon]